MTLGAIIEDKDIISVIGVTPRQALTQGICTLSTTQIAELPDTDDALLNAFAATLSEPVYDPTQVANVFENLYRWSAVRSDIAVVVLQMLELANNRRHLGHLIDNVIRYGRCDRMDQQIFEFNIILLSEVAGLMLSEPGRYAEQVHIATAFLLSLSNENSDLVRQCLLNYFCLYSTVSGCQKHLIKIMNRFGYTALNHCFDHLFSFTSLGEWQRAFVVKYLPLMLSLPDEEQGKLGDVFKFAMLNQPELFVAFLRFVLGRLQQSTRRSGSRMRRVVHAHLHALLDVSCSVDQKYLVSELIAIIEEVHGPEAKNQSVDLLLAKGVFRGRLKKILSDARKKGAEAIAYYQLNDAKEAAVQSFIDEMQRRFRPQTTPVIFWQITTAQR